MKTDRTIPADTIMTFTGRGFRLRAMLAEAAQPDILPAAAIAGDQNFAAGTANPDPGMDTTIPADSHTMEQAVYVLLQLAESNLHALESSFRDADLKNALEVQSGVLRAAPSSQPGRGCEDPHPEDGRYHGGLRVGGAEE